MLGTRISIVVSTIFLALLLVTAIEAWTDTERLMLVLATGLLGFFLGVLIINSIDLLKGEKDEH